MDGKRERPSDGMVVDCKQSVIRGVGEEKHHRRRGVRGGWVEEASNGL